MQIKTNDGSVYDFPDTASILRDQPFPGWFTVTVADESAPRVTWFNSYMVISMQSGGSNVG